MKDKIFDLLAKILPKTKTKQKTNNEPRYFFHRGFLIEELHTVPIPKRKTKIYKGVVTKVGKKWAFQYHLCDLKEQIDQLISECTDTTAKADFGDWLAFPNQLALA